jgi:FAD/FMN-containing dehydrogenase
MSSTSIASSASAARREEGLALLRASLPRDSWLDDPAEMAGYLTDWRGMYRGRAPLVLRPRGTEHVSAALRICNEHGIGVVPQGGNTCLTGGAVPSEEGREIVLSLDRLDRIRAMDPEGFTITVDAGCILAEIQKAAEGVDRFFPLSLGAEGSCRIGGNLSTNAGGIQVVRYGMARDLVLGLEVVLPDGRVLDGLSALRKDNTGYDLKQLFIGAEGTLGVITGAILKLFPQPRDRVTGFYAVQSPAAALALFGELRDRTADGILAFELIQRPVLDLVFKHIPGAIDPIRERQEWYVLFEVAGAPIGGGMQQGIEACTEGWLEAGLVLDGTVAASEAQRAAFWRIRESMADAQKAEGIGIRHDVSVPINSIPAFFAQALPAVASAYPGVRPIAFGHAGDGNIHFNLLQPPGMPDSEFLTATPLMNRVVHDIVAGLGGSISAEHGIGRLRRGELPAYKSDVQMELMRGLKRLLDPNGIMNPGKLL